MDYYTRQFLIQVEEMNEVEEEYWSDVDAEYLAEREYMADMDDEVVVQFDRSDCPF